MFPLLARGVDAMPALDVISGNQLQAVSGRRGRPVLGDLLLAARADLPGRLAFQQRERELALQEQEQQLQAQGLAVQERAQREATEAQQRAQGQQVIGTAISGVGQGAQLYTLAKETGVLSSLGLGGGAASGATALGGAAAPTTAYATGAAAEAVPVATATPAATGAIGSLASGGAIAGASGIAGRLTGKPVEQKVGGFGGKVAGHATGAATGAGIGALAGTFVFPGIGTAAGAVIGAIAGGLGASFCVLHEASYGCDSLEVQIARQFRDRFLTTAQLRAYYGQYEPVADRMRHDKAYRMHVRTVLTDRLVRYGAAVMQIPYAPPSRADVEVARTFLRQLALAGEHMPPFRRKNGDLV